MAFAHKLHVQPPHVWAIMNKAITNSEFSLFSPQELNTLTGGGNNKQRDSIDSLISQKTNRSSIAFDKILQTQNTVKLSSTPARLKSIEVKASGRVIRLEAKAATTSRISMDSRANDDDDDDILFGVATPKKRETLSEFLRNSGPEDLAKPGLQSRPNVQSVRAATTASSHAAEAMRKSKLRLTVDSDDEDAELFGVKKSVKTESLAEFLKNSEPPVARRPPPQSTLSKTLKPSVSRKPLSKSSVSQPSVLQSPLLQPSVSQPVPPPKATHPLQPPNPQTSAKPPASFDGDEHAAIKSNIKKPNQTLAEFLKTTAPPGYIEQRNLQTTTTTLPTTPKTPPHVTAVKPVTKQTINAIDDEDDDEDDALFGITRRPLKRKEETLAEFLRNSGPPAESIVSRPAPPPDSLKRGNVFFSTLFGMGRRASSNTSTSAVVVVGKDDVNVKGAVSSNAPVKPVVPSLKPEVRTSPQNNTARASAVQGARAFGDVDAPLGVEISKTAVSATKRRVDDPIALQTIIQNLTRIDARFSAVFGASLGVGSSQKEQMQMQLSTDSLVPAPRIRKILVSGGGTDEALSGDVGAPAVLRHSMTQTVEGAFGITEIGSLSPSPSSSSSLVTPFQDMVCNNGSQTDHVDDSNQDDSNQIMVVEVLEIDYFEDCNVGLENDDDDDRNCSPRSHRSLQCFNNPLMDASSLHDCGCAFTSGLFLNIDCSDHRSICVECKARQEADDDLMIDSIAHQLVAKILAPYKGESQIEQGTSTNEILYHDSQVQSDIVEFVTESHKHLESLISQLNCENDEIMSELDHIRNMLLVERKTTQRIAKEHTILKYRHEKLTRRAYSCLARQREQSIN